MPSSRDTSSVDAESCEISEQSEQRLHDAQAEDCALWRSAPETSASECEKDAGNDGQRDKGEHMVTICYVCATYGVRGEQVAKEAGYEQRQP
jgi:hypothetical protein